MTRGFVYLVGAGIGGERGLTLQARDLLCQAEVVVADDLVDQRLRSLTSASCEWITAGKRAGKTSYSQSEINQLLIDRAVTGKMTVRLKSGDPWVFGRVLEEIAALAAAQIGWEVVPGLSSAIVAPLLAGIPLTEADRSSCFVVATGHDPELLPWQALAAIPTVVILMGTRSLSVICARLKDYRSPDTPIALIHNCGSWNQQVWTGSLDHIDLPRDFDLSPAVIVVGEVVKHRSWLCANLPLSQKKIIVTRSMGQSQSFVQDLERLGAIPIEMPTLEIVPPPSYEELDRAIACLDRYSWLILTSANGVESFFQRLFLQNKDCRHLYHLKVAVVGKKTKEVLQSYGILADLVPPDFIADSLIEIFPDVNDQFVLFPRVASGGREVLITQLTAKGAVVDSVPAYESVCPETIPEIALEALQSQTIDVITFASSKTVLHFAQMLDKVADRSTWQEWIKEAKIASIGTQTSATCRQVFARVDIEAQEFTLNGLKEAIVNYFNVSSLRKNSPHPSIPSPTGRRREVE